MRQREWRLWAAGRHDCASCRTFPLCTRAWFSRPFVRACVFQRGCAALRLPQMTLPLPPRRPQAFTAPNVDVLQVRCSAADLAAASSLPTWQCPWQANQPVALAVRHVVARSGLDPALPSLALSTAQSSWVRADAEPFTFL